MAFLQVLPDGKILLSLYVQPRSSRNELAGLHGESLKLRLTTPPVDGKANKAVISFLAKLLKLPKSAVYIKSGLHSRSKKIVVTGLGEDVVRRVLT
ncbi:MAG: YggU family protein [Desulfobulbus sp.]|nr:MAG: YggU family protein [Desulfobulbus sp.]RUM40399.1 MAG: YggU family protein [Desulfobulbus sp.]